MGTSPTTGEEFYSGDYRDVRDVCRVLNIGDGKMSQITQPMVEKYQERVDREIDGILGDLYYTPLIARNQVQPDGSEKLVFPGDLRRHALYWSAGLLLANEFQGLDPNVNESVTSYIEDSRRSVFALKRNTHWMRGQERRSHISHTLPPTMQPPDTPEQDF